MNYNEQVKAVSLLLQINQFPCCPGLSLSTREGLEVPSDSSRHEGALTLILRNIKLKSRGVNRGK